MRMGRQLQLSLDNRTVWSLYLKDCMPIKSTCNREKNYLLIRN